MRRLHLKPIDKPSETQLALLQDAAKGALQRFRYGWRRPPTGRLHARPTAESLINRGYLSFEHGLLVITPRGRVFLMLKEAARAA